MCCTCTTELISSSTGLNKIRELYCLMSCVLKSISIDHASNLLAAHANAVSPEISRVTRSA
jgi:hypothetical protein